jgi:hypothetical protein
MGFGAMTDRTTDPDWVKHWVTPDEVDRVMAKPSKGIECLAPGYTTVCGRTIPNLLHAAVQGPEHVNCPDCRDNPEFKRYLLKWTLLP